MLDKFTPRLRAVCLFVGLFEVEISSRTQIPLLRPGSVHSVSAN